MRHLSVAVAVVVAACSPPSEVPREPPNDAGVATRGPIVQTWSARGDANPSVYAFTDLEDGGVATGPLSLQFALNEQFPQIIDVKPNYPAYVRRGCDNGTQWGSERFTSVTQTSGDAAKLSIVDGQLHVELKSHGWFQARVDGVITGTDCTYRGNALVDVPTSHLVDIRVVEIAGFEVSHFAQRSGCGNKLVVAERQTIQLPKITALDVRDEELSPLNAPRPVTFRLRGEGDVLVDRAATETVRLSPGRTAIELDTPLPVRGLDALYAVDAASVTAADVELGLVVTYIKGEQWHTLADGATYRVPYPDESNSISVRSHRVETTEGALCTQPPADWFVATVQTPSTCTSSGATGNTSYWSNVAKVIAAGECVATIGLRGTNLTWSTRFFTSF